MVLARGGIGWCAIVTHVALSTIVSTVIVSISIVASFATAIADVTAVIMWRGWGIMPLCFSITSVVIMVETIIHRWASRASTVARSHSSKESSSTITAVVWTWNCAEVVVASVAVEIIDAEVPAVVDKCYWSMKIAVAYDTIPHYCAKECAECHIACGAYVDVVIVIITKSHIVEVIVDTPNVVIVDTVYLIYQVWVSYAKGICHAVGKETGIVADGCKTHALSVNCRCSCHEEECCE